MKDFIIEEATKIFHTCLTNLEKTSETPSLLLRINQGEMRYTVCEKHYPKKDISFKEILGVKIDLKGYSIVVPPKIKEILEGFEKEYGSDIAVAIYKNEEEEGFIRLFLFVKAEVKKEFHLEDVIQI